MCPATTSPCASISELQQGQVTSGTLVEDYKTIVNEVETYGGILAEGCVWGVPNCASGVLKIVPGPTADGGIH